MSSPTDTTLTCPHGRACGACAFLGIETSAQLRRKHWTLKNALRQRETLRELEVLPCLPSPQNAGYRNRAKMAVGMPRKGGLELGYFKAGTREIVDAPDCRVLEPELLATLTSLREFLTTTNAMPRELRHVDLRCGSDPQRQHLTLVLRTDELPRLPLGGLSDACPNVSGFSANLNPSGGPQVIKGPIEHLWGEREVTVETAGLHLRVSPGSFFQVNLSLLAKIHSLMADFLGEGERLIDLYAGVGTHGLALREKFGAVTCVEGTRSSVNDTKASVKANRLSGIQVVGATVERSMDTWIKAGGDALVMNPSRAGAQQRVLEGIAASRALRVAYLSCEPETLARDLEILQELGFELVSVQPLDMMPQTKQVEGLALLQRSEGGSTRPVRGKARRPSKTGPDHTDDAVDTERPAPRGKGRYRKRGRS